MLQKNVRALRLGLVAGIRIHDQLSIGQILGYHIDEAVCAATVNSASVVGHVDTQAGLLRRQELDQKVAAGPDDGRCRCDLCGACSAAASSAL